MVAMSKNETTHYASVYRAAVREATHVELQLALGRIERATHVVLGNGNDAVYSYGTQASCESFVFGIERSARVEPMTHEIRERESAHKVRVYRKVSR
jgi:hypothetical protein